MAQASAALVGLTLFTIMFALGLGLQLDAIAQLRHSPALVIRVLIGSCVLVPLLALVLMTLPLSFVLSPSARFGIVLMAACPSAPLTLRKAGKTGGDRQLAGLLQACAALAAMVPFVASNWLALGFMAVMVTAALAIGSLMAGPEPCERITVALVTSMATRALLCCSPPPMAKGCPA